MLSPAFALLANRSLPFSLYDFHLSGVSAKELADAYGLPLFWVEERLEAVRLCLKFQVKLGFSQEETQSAAHQGTCRPVLPKGSVIPFLASA
jgi:hypothetical protein